MQESCQLMGLKKPIDNNEIGFGSVDQCGAALQLCYGSDNVCVLLSLEIRSELFDPEISLLIQPCFSRLLPNPLARILHYMWLGGWGRSAN